MAIASEPSFHTQSALWRGNARKFGVMSKELNVLQMSLNPATKAKPAEQSVKCSVLLLQSIQAHLQQQPNDLLDSVFSLKACELNKI